MKKYKIAINGFGRIGRMIFRKATKNSSFDIVGINDLYSVENSAYLLKYDTARGPFDMDVKSENGSLLVNDRKIRFTREKDIKNINWKELDVDLVFECSGAFTSREAAGEHISSGAKSVIISAPASGDLKTVVYGVNNETLNGSEEVISAASCTTNCLAPIVKLLNEQFGIINGFVSTVHAYTADQLLMDMQHPGGDLRKSRAGAMNIIPTSTGAAIAIGKVIPELHGKLDGIAFRVPTVAGSLVDLVATLKESVTKDLINSLIKEASEGEMNGIVGYTEEPLVSSDILNIEVATLFDASLTNVIGGSKENMIKIVSWYDNEMSYVNQILRLANYFLVLKLGKL